MRAIGKNIVVKILDQDVKTESGIFLSGDDVDQLRYAKARVVAVGSDIRLGTINVDDVIHYDKVHGYTMIINDIQYTIIQDRDVVVVV